MKRSGPIKRSKFSPKNKRPLKARKHHLPCSTKKIAKVNLRAAKKKRAKYDAFMKSPEWKAIRTACLERAGNRCEYVELASLTTLILPIPVTRRCPMTTTLTCHHKRYTRELGQERPSDLMCLCKAHHDCVESLKPGLRLWQRALG